MKPDAATVHALNALSWLVNSPEALERFMVTTGLSADEIRSRAGESEFLAAILDFLLRDESLLIAFCTDESLDARDLHRALHILGNP